MPPMGLASVLHACYKREQEGSDWSFLVAPHVLRLACAAIDGASSRQGALQFTRPSILIQT